MIRIVLAGLALAFSSVAAPAQQAHQHHDIYRDLLPDGTYKSIDGNPNGLTSCCGDDPNTGDCEPVGANYTVLPNGNVVMQIKRYGAREVLIPKDKVLWMSVKGGEWSEAHWCGIKRVPTAPTADQPNPDLWTYCAMIAAGGV